jgi:N-methylhydantoinase A
MVDVHTVGTGGGSIGWVDAGGALRVGPRSAGAVPGPACYGAGGEDATVTDANLALGYLDPDAVLPGEIALDASAAERALSALGELVGLDAVQAAAGILRVADQDMLRALRVITVERGIDPRRYALVAFGGAGPMHAARIAEQLGVSRVLCPRASGVLSALGLVVSERRRDFARSLLLSGPDLTAQRIAAAVAELSEEALAQFPGARVEVSYDLRYHGQAFELSVEESARPDPARLREHFERAHDERYGYSDGGAQLELVNVRVAALAGGATPELTSAAGAHVVRGSRQVLFGGERLQTAVVTGEPPAGERLKGPAVCELPEATVVIPPGWGGEVGRDGTLALDREGRTG